MYMTPLVNLQQDTYGNTHGSKHMWQLDSLIYLSFQYIIPYKELISTILKLTKEEV